MSEILIFILGVAAGSVFASLWISARNRWKRARGMLSAPAKAKDEGRASVKKARNEAAKGRSEMVRAGFTIFLIVLVLAVVVAIVIFLIA